MYSPQLADDLIAQLYLEAKRLARPMTSILNDIVRNYFLSENVKKKCSKCGKEMNVCISQDTGYCETCESEVFVN